MTTPQPQQITRYEPTVSTVYPPMRETADGRYIRIDDPAIVAAREAIAELIAMCEPMCHDDEGDGDPLAKYRLALANLTPKEDAR